MKFLESLSGCRTNGLVALAKSRTSEEDRVYGSEYVVGIKNNCIQESHFRFIC